MKKLVSLGLIGLSSMLFAGVTVVPSDINNTINTEDINYRYNFNLKKCEPFDYELKSLVVNMLRTNRAIVENVYNNDAGTAYEMSYKNEGKVFDMVLTNTYGECRLYEDIVLKGKNIKESDVSIYSKMRYR